MSATEIQAIDESDSASLAHKKTVPLYRLYSPFKSDHLYTTSTKERQEAIKEGYIDESVAAQVLPKKTTSESEPLYRIFRFAVDHFYTVSEEEKAQVLAFPYTIDEGIACYIYKTQLRKTVPLYRMFNTTLNDHFYTIDAQERIVAITQLGYGDEGVTGYVFPASQTGDA